MNADFQNLTRTSSRDRRSANRRVAVIPGRIIWHDSRGTPRFSSVVTRDVSDRGVFVECLSGPPIPMHRLVHLQLDKVAGAPHLPAPLVQGKVLSAVYRVGAVSRVTGLPEGYALRLLTEASIPAIAAEPAAKRLALPA